MKRPVKKSRWQRVDFIDQALLEIAPAIPGANHMGSDSKIVAAHAFRDRKGVWQRIHARFANGWRLTSSRRKDGSWSVSWALKMNVGSVNQ